MSRATVKGAAKGLSPRQMASLMTEVSSDLLKTEKHHVTSKWFRAGDDLEMFAWFDRKNTLIRLQVVVFDQVLEWDLVQGLKTGFIEESSNKRKLQKESSLIIFDSRLNQPTVDFVRQIIEGTPNMSDAIKAKIVSTVFGESLGSAGGGPSVAGIFKKFFKLFSS